MQLLRVLACVLDPLVHDAVPSRLGRRRLGGERIGRGGLPDVGHVRLPGIGRASSVDIAKVHAGRARSEPNPKITEVPPTQRLLQ